MEDDRGRRINKSFSSDSTNEQLMFVLYGLGGSGKSEIMRRFVANAQLQTEGHSRRYSYPVSLCTFERETKFPPFNPSLRFSEVLYVDASSVATLEVDLASISVEKKLGEKAKDTISWLVRTRDRWLLILDNADDATLNLRQYIPACSHGNIIITTRNRQLEIYDRSLEVSRMSEVDAKDLFIRRSGIANLQVAETDQLITQIIKVWVLSCLIDAIVCLTVNTGA